MDNVGRLYCGYIVYRCPDQWKAGIERWRQRIPYAIRRSHNSAEELCVNPPPGVQIYGPVERIHVLRVGNKLFRVNVTPLAIDMQYCALTVPDAQFHNLDVFPDKEPDNGN